MLQACQSLADRGRLDEALTACAAEDTGPARSLLEARIHGRLGANDDALTLFQEALSQGGPPRVSADALLGLAATYARSGQRMTAREHVLSALKLQPDDAVARHLRATLGNLAAETPLHDEIASLFDDYAGFYDHHLVQTLKYCGPRLVASALVKASPTQALDLIVDLGCGTGLCGPTAGMFGQALVGVDLSAEMVTKCRQVAEYDAVWQDDAVHALRTFGDGSAGAILAADVVGYIRDVEALFAEARRVLTPDGCLIISVEEYDGGEDVKLGPSRRIQFAESYLRRAAQGAGLDVTGMDRAPIREESGVGVPGLILTLTQVTSGRNGRRAPA